ncbi:FAD-dependent oxidoreductase [Demequina aurantiaca]|uniref:FAD-dependent oxidoreductase n=1 Tax=Demequina aurantiaca TaxID=676200 RepID=UPI003D344A41
MAEANRADLPVVVIGAGPVGLAAAAQLLERGLEPLVIEAGESPGATVSTWGHVRLFSPWRYDIDDAARRLLEGTDWVEPDLDELPTGAELVSEYLTPLAATHAISSRLTTGTKVLAVARDGADKTRTLGRERRGYRVRTVNSQGGVEDVLARAVIDASGTFATSNPLGTSGMPAAGERAAGEFITGPLPDVLGAQRSRFAGVHTLVVGMGHSAANTLLSLIELAESEPGTTVTWAIRGGSTRRLLGGGADDELPARGLLGERLQAAVEAGRLTLVKWASIEQIVVGTGTGTGTVRVLGKSREETIDLEVGAIVNATGFRPNLDMLREVRLDLDPVVESPRQLAELIDPNFHSCGTVPPHGEALLRHPDDGFYIAGMKSYGRAPTFLLATGYEQVRSIAAALAGDQAGADLVQLNLPATGVCESDINPDAEEGSGGLCCSAEPSTVQPLTLETLVPAGAGFGSGVAHGRSGDQPKPANTCG